MAGAQDLLLKSERTGSSARNMVALLVFSAWAVPKEFDHAERIVTASSPEEEDTRGSSHRIVMGRFDAFKRVTIPKKAVKATNADGWFSLRDSWRQPSPIPSVRIDSREIEVDIIP
ncbi:MAG: hypothetical protein O7F12_01745 [Nitrospirae bacterium]|nr:hypothetical protein [Nitrospirota bacterium]